MSSMAGIVGAIRIMRAQYDDMVKRAEAAEADLEACAQNAVNAVAAYRKRAETAEAKLAETKR